MTDLDDYRRRGWRLVPIPAGQKGPVARGWQTRTWSPADFPPGGNVGLILGPPSGELVDVDLDCPEALALADLYLVTTGAEFGRPSKPRSHRLYIAPGAVYATFADPSDGSTLLELRAPGRDGGAHQTLVPPSTADGEQRAWHGDAIAPAVVEAPRLRCCCAWLATACLVYRHVSRHAAEHPAPDLACLLYEADHDLGQAAFRWLGEPEPDLVRSPKPRRELTRAEIDLAELVAAIPNNEDWHGWNRLGLAIYGASGGSDQGGMIFDDWSAKSPKYDPYVTVARWRHYHRSPPDRIGIGTLIHLAREAGWRPREGAA